MDIGIALPTMAPGYGPTTTVDWARGIDAGPFSSVSTGERISFDNQDWTVALAAAAAVTERVRVIANVVVLPLHPAAEVAKQAVALDQVSNGRFTLGVGGGGREHDYRSLGASFSRRHAHLDEQVAELRRLWAGEPPFEGADPIGPPPVQAGGAPPLAGLLRPQSMAPAAPRAQGTPRRTLGERRVTKPTTGPPATLFSGPGTPACIIVLDKAGSEKRAGIFIIDASKGYIKDGNKNRLREQDIHRITDVFRTQAELPRFSRLVAWDEIQRNEFNLNIPRYIDSTEPEDIQDLSAHLQGGIPDRDLDALAPYWKVYPGLRKDLFAPNARTGYSDLKVPAAGVRARIFGHPEFTAYATELEAVLTQRRTANEPPLRGGDGRTKPRPFIAALGEGLLKAYTGKALVDPYTMYQHLMDYWNGTLKDDVYMLVEDGWRAVPEPVKDKKSGKVKAGEFTCDLLPQRLVIARYFAKEQAKVEELQRAHEALAQQLEELIEEHSGEEGALAECMNEKGKVTKAGVAARFAEIAKDTDYAEEVKVLKEVDRLMEAEAKAKKAHKVAFEALDTAAWNHYKQLTEAEVKDLVVRDKWLADLHAAVLGEQERISQRLAARVVELAERYGRTLPALDREVEALTAKVEQHLKHMELAWN